MNPFVEVIHVLLETMRKLDVYPVCLSEESPEFFFFFFTTFKKKSRLQKKNHKQCNIWIRVRNIERQKVRF